MTDRPGRAIDEGIEDVTGFTASADWMLTEPIRLLNWVKKQTASPSPLTGASRIKQLMLPLIAYGVTHIPVQCPGGKQFYARREPGGSQVRIMYKEETGEPRMLFDPENIRDSDKPTRMTSWGVSPDGALMHTITHPDNNDQTVMRIIRVPTGVVVQRTDGITASPCPLDRYQKFISRMSAAWSIRPDSTPVLIYTNAGPNGELPSEIQLHIAGTDINEDKNVFPKQSDDKFPSGVLVSPKGRRIVVVNFSENDIDLERPYVGQLTDDGIEFVPVTIVDDPSIMDQLNRFEATPDKIDMLQGADTIKKTAYIAIPHGDMLYIWVSSGKGKVMSVPLDQCEAGPSGWKTFIPEGEHSISDFKVSNGVFHVEYRHPEGSSITLVNPDGTVHQSVGVPLGNIEGSATTDTDGVPAARICVSTPEQPYQVYQLPLNGDDPIVEQGLGADVLGNSAEINQKDFEVRQIEVPYEDREIKVDFLVRKGLALNNASRIILIGYGGNGARIGNEIRPEWLTAAAMGAAVGKVHLSGDGTFGDDQHKRGIGRNIATPSLEFAAVADAMRNTHGVEKSKVVGCGGSYGAGTVLSSALRYPESFGSIVCVAGWLDRSFESNNNHPKNPGYLQQAFGEKVLSEDPGFCRSNSPLHMITPTSKVPRILFIVPRGETARGRVDARDSYRAIELLRTVPENQVSIQIVDGSHGGTVSAAEEAQNSSQKLAWIFQGCTDTDYRALIKNILDSSH